MTKIAQNQSEAEIISKQRIEIEYWNNSLHECPTSDSIWNVVNKMSDAAVFLECITRHQDKLLPEDGKVLELGCGQGWASCLYKRLFPNAHVTATDISKHAVMSLPKWERFLEVKVDNSYECLSYRITNEHDASLDIVFCFSAAHHFLAHKRTLREINRVLKPGGKAFYFYEPATPNVFYSFVYKRLNDIRSCVPEDVLRISEIRKLASNEGFEFEVDYHPSLVKRGPIEMLYFFALNQVPFLQKILPCTVNLIFTKQA